jgi:hypothetical protein
MKKRSKFDRWLSLRQNSFGVDSASDTLAQCAINSFLQNVAHNHKKLYKRGYRKSKFRKTNKELI